MGSVHMRADKPLTTRTQEGRYGVRAGPEDPTRWDLRVVWLALPMQPRGSGSPAYPGNPMSATLVILMNQR